MIAVEGFFDCSCVWAYLAYTHVSRFASERGISVRWRPVLAGDLFDTVNAVARQPLPSVKATYYANDLKLWAEYLDCPLLSELPEPFEAVDCMRACVAAQRWDQLEPFMSAAYAAAWTRGDDLTDRSVIAQIWAEAKLPSELFALSLDWPGVDAELSANTRELAARGGFGVPSFFVGDDLHFGNDSVPLLERAVIARMKETGLLVAG